MSAIQRISQLEQRMNALQVLLGVTLEEWMSPNEAAKLISISRPTLMKMIETAESARATGQRYQMQYGLHYRQIPGTRNWQVNWEAVRGLINQTPPEQWDEVA